MPQERIQTLTDKNMKMNLTTILGGMACVMGLGLGAATASIVTRGSGTVDITVPDGNAAGITSTINVSGLGNVLNSVSLTLNISGGNNGDLYAYLSYNGTSVVLLNRPGLTGDSAGIGYTTAGYNNVTLSDGGYANINTTQNPATGGTYNPSAGSLAFANYDGVNPNGNWVLFVSDLNGGDVSFSQLDSWSLTFNAVPEPVDVALGLFAAALLAVAGLRRARGYFKFSSNNKAG
jgi:subtilisin-like proprotein convertase family protein